MDAACDSGKPFASGRVHLVQERDLPVVNRQSGFLIYVPVYRKNALLDTEQQRRDALLGFVYSPLRAEDFINAVIGSKTYDVNFQVYDGTEAKPENLLGSVGNEISAKPTFTVAKQQDVPGMQVAMRGTSRRKVQTRSAGASTVNS